MRKPLQNKQGRIYDKLCGYIEDMEKLGRALDNAEKPITAP